MVDATILILVLVIVGLTIYLYNTREQLCIRKTFGVVTDVPASVYTNANMALVHSTSIGQAPLGDPNYWLPSGSPITQGQWALYQDKPLTLEEAQNLDRSSLDKAAQALPVYDEKPF